MNKDKFALRKHSEGVTQPSTGFHAAFSAPNRPAIDAAYAAALAVGGEDNGPPGLRLHYGSHYYAAFLHDPDGYAIEIVKNTPD